MSSAPADHVCGLQGFGRGADGLNDRCLACEQDYAAVIPAWCGARTLQAHVDMLLCWGLVRYAECKQPKPEHTCKACDLYEPRNG